MQLNVLEYLLNHENIEYLIAGGYARDKHFGETPKDIDIFVGDMGAVRRVLNSTGIAYQDFTNCPEYSGTNRFGSVLKVGDIDIIEIAEEAHSPLDQVQRFFDFNVNQFIILNGHAMFVGKDYGNLSRSSSEPITVEREDKIRAKAAKFGWELPEKELDIFG